MEKILEKKFTNNEGFVLPLEKILKQKIISLDISYLSNKEIKKYFFGLIKKEKKQENKLLTIDDSSIVLEVKGNGQARVRFSSKEEFEKLKKDTFDEETIFKKFIFTIFPQYTILFDIRNLEKINWY